MNLIENMKDLPAGTDAIEHLKAEIKAVKNAITVMENQPELIRITTEKTPPMQKQAIMEELVSLDGDIVQYSNYVGVLESLKKAYKSVLKNRQDKLTEVLGVTDALRGY